MSYENHPGFEASDCPLRMTIKAHPTGMSYNGYACRHTGGHCLPKDDCKEFTDAYATEEEMEENCDNFACRECPINDRCIMFDSFFEAGDKCEEFLEDIDLCPNCETMLDGYSNGTECPNCEYKLSLWILKELI